MPEVVAEFMTGLMASQMRKRKRPYAYLRKSKVFRATPVLGKNGKPVFDADGKVVMSEKKIISPEMQLAEVRALCKRSGFDPDELVVFEDMNISGRKGRDKRPGFECLADGDRGGRGLGCLLVQPVPLVAEGRRHHGPFAELCGHEGIPIYLAKDQNPDMTTSSGRLMLSLLAAFAQFESDIASERMLDIAEFRRGRGDKLGGAYFVEAERVRDAFIKAGTLAGAARQLKVWGVKTRNGNDVWSATAVRGIIARAFPEIAPSNPTRGAGSFLPYWFYRMVVCHCGRIMTGRRDKARSGRPYGPGYVRYICLAGRMDPDHGRSYIPEPVVRAAVEAELRHFRLPFDAVAEEQSDEARARLVELKTRREGIGWSAAEGLIPRDEALAKAREIDDEIHLIELAGATYRVTADMDWSDTVGTNRNLRRLFSKIEVSRDMTVKRLEWTEPLFRSEESVAAA